MVRFKCLFILCFVALLFSCKSEKKYTPEPKEGVAKVIAVYIKQDGAKSIDVLVRQILKVIKYDAALKKDVIKVDTLWAYPVMVPARDSLGIGIVDTLGKPKLVLAYALIGKDSVNYKVESIPIDSLLKK